MNFVALDVETANADYSSICQIGIVEFKNGDIVDKWSSLVNPEAFFDPFNSSIHGIYEDDIEDSPTFDKIYELLKNKINDKIVIHHMPFDKIALNRACTEYGLDFLNPKWLDSAKITRRVWTDFAYKGYGLGNITKFLGIDFKHHDALEDAIAAGMVVCKACELSNITIEDWLLKVDKPIFERKDSSKPIKLEGNKEGYYYGENIVFTGTLNLVRKEAALIASQMGCNVSNSVTKKTTILVVGSNDMSKLNGYEKSSKHRKAEDLIIKGAELKILSENDFYFNFKIDKPKMIKEKSHIKPPSKVNESDFINLKSHLKKIDNISQEEKRKLAKKFNKSIEEIFSFFSEFEEMLDEKFDRYEEANSDFDFIIDSMEAGIDELEEYKFDLMKNKISYEDFIENIDAVKFSLELDRDDLNDLENNDFNKLISNIIDKLINVLTKFIDLNANFKQSTQH